MSRIQKKLVVFFGIIGFGTVAVLGVLLTWRLAQEYARMEEHFSNDCMRQVAGAFEQEFTRLKNNVTDWGRWDALYSFMSTRDPAFLRENIPEAVVGNLDLDLLVLADKGGEAVVVYTRQLAESGVRDLLVLLRSGGPLSVAAGDVNPKSGIVWLAGEPLIAAAHVITSADGAAPPAGVLVMARRISEPMLNRVRQASTLTVRVVADPGPEMAWLERASPGKPVFHPLNSRVALAGMVMTDITGRHRIAVVADLPRDLHRQFLLTVSRFFAGLFVVMLVALGLFLGFLKWNIIDRVLFLQQEIATIDPEQADESRVTCDGKDEIRDLQVSINILLNRISETRKILVRERQVFDALVSSAREAIFLMDDAGRVVFANRAVEQIFGWRPEEIIGQDLHDKLAPERYHEDVRAGMSVFRETGEGLAIDSTLELTARRRDGSEFPVEVSLAALRMDGRWHALGIVRDITERKRAERSAQQTGELMRTIMENIRYGVLLIDRNYRIVLANAAARQYAVRQEGDICYQVYNLSAPTAPCVTCPVTGCFQDGQVHETRRVVRYPDGQQRIFRLMAFPVRSSVGAGPTDLVVELFEDITEEENRAREMSQHQRLEAVGRLAAGIAHEINTPIQYVGDNLEFLGEAIAAFCARLDGGESGTSASDDDIAFFIAEAPRAVTQAREGVDRVATIVRAMKAFSHPSTAEKTLRNINQDILNTVTVSRNEWKYVADVRTELDESLPPVPCYPGELNQVYLNLIVNAAHAIGDKVGRNSEEKGLITIATRQVGQQAEIRISDTGTGIPESVRDKIFEPFFTTKEVGRGTGQGLAIARDVIVNKHGGTITFETREGEGTTFIIRLPLGEPEPQDHDSEKRSRKEEGA